MPPRRIYEHSGPAELVLEGENLTPDTLKLYHNGVLYTPLVSSDTYAYYLLGDNGTNKVMLNGKYFFGVEVSGIVVPAFLPINFTYGLTETFSPQGAWSASQNKVTNCVNYPVLLGEGRYLKIQIMREDSPSFDFSALECQNGTIVTNEEYSSSMYNIVVAEATDLTKPTYITYQGFIIAVSNYTN